MAHVLIVDDEPAIAELVALHLKLAGHTSHILLTGQNVMNYIGQTPPDIIILDVMLPARDGFTLMQDIAPTQIPVIFLTAKDNVNDKVAGLRLGADDYIVKPFAALELITRIETVLRRTKRGGNIFSFPPLCVHLDERVVLLNDEKVELTTKEFELLELLIENKNLALSRDQLLNSVWGYEYSGETRTVDVHIQKLRKKLHLEERIKTIYKYGYRLEVTK